MFNRSSVVCQARFGPLARPLGDTSADVSCKGRARMRHNLHKMVLAEGDGGSKASRPRDGRGGRNASVTDEAIERIRQMIISGEWGPGTRLPREAELAARLGISRNSPREAVPPPSPPPAPPGPPGGAGPLPTPVPP